MAAEMFFLALFVDDILCTPSDPLDSAFERERPGSGNLLFELLPGTMGVGYFVTLSSQRLQPGWYAIFSALSNPATSASRHPWGSSAVCNSPAIRASLRH
jgi:hypothetical protein